MYNHKLISSLNNSVHGISISKHTDSHNTTYILMMMICLIVYTCALETSKHEIVEVNDNGCIVSFLEKPLPSTTKSRLAVSFVE